jgi:hypothetical protein
MDRNESGVATPVERIAGATLTNSAQVNLRAPRGQANGGARAACLHSTEQAPADIGENKEASNDQRAGNDAAQRGARHGMGELGAEPGAAA